MKTVKSIADLKQMALARGASVQVGATRYNAGGEKIARLERQPAPAAAPAPAPVPVPAPAPAPAAAPVVNVDMAPIASAQDRMAQMLGQALAAMPQPAAPVREWLFTVERDSNGLLTSIRATAQP